MKSFLKDGGYNERGLKFFSGAVSEADILGDNCLVIANTDVTRNGDIIGAPALVPSSLGGFDVVCSHHVTALRFTDDCDARFLFHLLRLPRLRAAFRQHARGTTVLMLDPRSIERIAFDHPSDVGEQRQIAKILDTLDTTIRQTEAIVEKLKQVKQGLLHDLLTRGIDDNGELRPPQSQAPHLYKDSPLGWIPREWEPVQLGKLASLQRGHDIVATNFRHGPYPVISSSGVIGHHSVATSRGPNVIVGRKGSIGTVHYVETDFWAHDTSLFVTNFFGNAVRFVFHLFDHMQLGRYGTKSGSPSLNRNDIHPLMVARPQTEEQERIVRVVAAHEAVQRDLDVEAIKFRCLKSGLMGDLLTGRVRVTPLLSTAAPA